MCKLQYIYIVSETLLELQAMERLSKSSAHTFGLSNLSNKVKSKFQSVHFELKMATLQFKYISRQCRNNIDKLGKVDMFDNWV